MSITAGLLVKVSQVSQGLVARRFGCRVGGLDFPVHVRMSGHHACEKAQQYLERWRRELDQVLQGCTAGQQGLAEGKDHRMSYGLEQRHGLVMFFRRHREKAHAAGLQALE
ncbi:hypothetical protein D3C84_918680 [compost metagenome]